MTGSICIERGVTNDLRGEYKKSDLYEAITRRIFCKTDPLRNIAFAWILVC